MIKGLALEAGIIWALILASLPMQLRARLKLLCLFHHL